MWVAHWKPRVAARSWGNAGASNNVSLLPGRSAMCDASGTVAEQYNQQEQRHAQRAEEPEGEVLVRRVDPCPLRGMVGHIRERDVPRNGHCRNSMVHDGRQLLAGNGLFRNETVVPV